MRLCGEYIVRANQTINTIKNERTDREKKSSVSPLFGNVNIKHIE